MMHDFELHEYFHSPKNVLLKALLYLLKWRPIFDKLSPNGDPKFGNFIWLQSILGQKPSFLGPIQLVRQKVNIH